MADIKKWFLLFCLALISINSVLAIEGDYLISNSENWQDVYSTLLYSNLEGSQGRFLTSVPHGRIIQNEIGRQNSIGVVTSRNQPFVVNYPSDLRNNGYQQVDEIVVRNANLELIENLEEINNFIVVGNRYGFDAIAVAPYAIQTGSWVFLANRNNIGEIDFILGDRNIENLIVYGHVDREVREALEKYNPEEINSGNRFKDNIEMVKRFKEIDDKQQVILTNGEFIEKEIMSGREPVLFTGRENVPNEIRDYLQDSNINVGVLIGNELIGAATNIRRTAGISVMVKFARGARAQQEGVAAVEGLDFFYLPTPILDLSIYSAQFNVADSSLRITYESNSNVPIYFRGTITLSSEAGRITFGDEEPIFIAPNNFRTVIYPNLNITGEELRAEIYTLYGDIIGALDREIEETIDVSIINIVDDCEIETKSIIYNIERERFSIEVDNVADVDCWVNIEIDEIIIDGVESVIGTESAGRIRPGRSGTFTINQRLAEQDIEDNSFVRVQSYYGEREDFLVKRQENRFALLLRRFTFITYLIISLIILIIILIIIAIIIKRRERNY